MHISFNVIKDLLKFKIFLHPSPPQPPPVKDKKHILLRSNIFCSITLLKSGNKIQRHIINQYKMSDRMSGRRAETEGCLCLYALKRSLDVYSHEPSRCLKHSQCTSLLSLCCDVAYVSKRVASLILSPLFRSVASLSIGQFYG